MLVHPLSELSRDEPFRRFVVRSETADVDEKPVVLGNAAFVVRPAVRLRRLYPYLA